MADSEIEETIEDVADDELLEDEASPEEVKNKWLTKPMIIKIAIGVSILLIGIGVGAYFFLMTDEPIVEEESIIEPIEESINESGEITDAAANIETEVEASINIDSLIDQADSETAVGTEQSDDTTESNETPATDKLSEKEEILKMREEAVSLQEENLRLKQQLMGLKPSQTMPVNESEKAKGDSPISAQDVNQYMDLYQDNLETYPSVRKPKSEPVPDPKWGE